MKHLIFTLVFFTGMISFSIAQNVGKMKNDTLINYIDINNKKQGKWVKHYDSGKIRYKGFFVNDKPTGTFMFYHSNGRVKSVLNYDDKGYSTTEIYWKSGNSAAKGSYDDTNTRIKTWHIYFEDGTLASVINYSVYGKPDGEVRMYYPGTNQKVLHCYYKNGKKHGTYKKFFPTGLTQEEGEYVDNLKEGIWKLYSPEGVLEEEGPFYHGRREGDWIVYTDAKGVDTINYQMGRAENYDEKMNEWREKEEWAKTHQNEFKQPEDYMDNPINFFRP